MTKYTKGAVAGKGDSPKNPPPPKPTPLHRHLASEYPQADCQACIDKGVGIRPEHRGEYIEVGFVGGLATALEDWLRSRSASLLYLPESIENGGNPFYCISPDSLRG